MHKGRTAALGILLSTAFVSGCQTVPPVFVYNRSYTDSSFRFASRARPGRNDALKPFDLVVVIKPSSDLVEKNNQRYMYGSFVKQLRNLRQYRKGETTADVKTAVPTFSIRFAEKENAQADYIARVNFSDYDQGFSVNGIENKDVGVSATATRCFLLAADIENPSNKLDRYSFKSNGCPGMSDPRLVAKKVFGILFQDLWAVDSTKTYTLYLNGSAATAWYSDLETDPEVDALLGYKENK